VSTPFRLLSSVLSAWRSHTAEMRAVKLEIKALKLERLRITQQREEQRLCRVEEHSRMHTASAFRDATLKAEIFCSWSDRCVSSMIMYNYLRHVLAQLLYWTICLYEYPRKNLEESWSYLTTRIIVDDIHMTYKRYMINSNNGALSLNFYLVIDTHRLIYPTPDLQLNPHSSP
jgi:hypothetical protein